MVQTLIPQQPIMVVDDEEHILLAIDTVLRMAGLTNVLTCRDSRQVMELLYSQSMEAVLLDLTMPNVNGEELLAMINTEFPELPVIVVTGSVDVETAVRCMRLGAFDYVVKPIEEGRLLTALSRVTAFRELKRENLALKQHILSNSLEDPAPFAEIITNSRKMVSIFQYIESIAPTCQSVLITGETGTGKELISRAIHVASGLKGDFVAVNVAGLDDNVFSDTLFGHVKGAFTDAQHVRHGMIERAAGGTLVMDEIGDLSNESQIKLLRFLQNGEYFPLGHDDPKQSQVRVIAVTNRDLRALRDEGRFRKDLYFRLQTHHIHIPSLQERGEDIPLLLDHFLKMAAEALNKKKPAVPRELLALLKTHSFPGNVRELEAMVFDAVSRHKSGPLSLSVFKSHIAKERKDRPFSVKRDPGETDLMVFPRELPTIKQSTKLLVTEAMKRANGNQSLAASMLGISQQALSKRLKQQRAEADKEK